MFVYNGIIDQANSHLVEFATVILPSRVDIGSPCIVLCLPGVHYSLQENREKDAQCPIAAAYTFEAVLEAMTVSPDKKVATFTSDSCGLILHLPNDMAMLQLSFRIDGKGPTLISSMPIAMHCPLSSSESTDYDQRLFLGPVHLDNQFQGYLAALIISEKGQQGEWAGSINACIAWNAKTAATAKAMPHAGPVPESLSLIEELEVEGQSQDAELGQAHFAVNNRSHEFRGTVSENALDLLLRARHDYSLSGSKDWSTVTIPQLDKHNKALLQMVSETQNSLPLEVYNYTNDVVTCTIVSSSADWYGYSMSVGGALLATLGLPGAPAMFAAGAAVTGFFLALKSLADTLWGTTTSKSMVLYPKDRMDLARSFWSGASYDIIIVMNRVDGSKLSLMSYRLSNVKQNNYDVKNVLSNRSTAKETIFEINLPRPISISNRRLMGIRGVKPDAEPDSYDTPEALYEGDVVLYRYDGTIDKSWNRNTIWRKRGEEVFLRASSQDGKRLIAIVHTGSQNFGYNNNLSIDHLLQDPYSPVLCIQYAHIGSDSRRKDFIPLEPKATTDSQVMERIQKNENSQGAYNWAYHHDSLEQRVYAWKWTAQNVVVKSDAYFNKVFFVFSPGSWTHTASLVM
ncbi:hypothetical protein FLONG3_10655 [Fusarium longipes]|uniref:Uncharacterized protein n=1 Tax=Fusarium longipes TaxID=694270 RepID=A0A395RLP7_9HYPO|nr:hypothetical protein FLONG3_10655 [Fusarium longipes]